MSVLTIRLPDDKHERLKEHRERTTFENKAMTTTSVTKISFAEYLNYDDGTNNRYELVEGKLVLMPPASFLYSDIIDFIADLIKTVVRENQLDIKVKTGDVGVRTGIDSSRIPDISVIDGQLWKSYRRDKSAVIEDSLLLAVEVVSPGKEQIERDYVKKLAEYRDRGIGEYWIVDSIEQKITVMHLDKGSYTQTVFGGDELIVSPTFPQLRITVNEILTA